jgi:RNA polymerase sigma-70 factor (ECF subfamily)
LPAPAAGGEAPRAADEAGDAADRDAVERVLDGDSRAFDPVVRRHGARLVALCARVTGAREVGEELAQEALARAYASLGSYRGDCQVRHWLMRIALNGCRDWLKAGARAERPVEIAEEALSTALAPDEELAGRQALSALEQALRSLPDVYREAFVLFHVENLSYLEMSRVTGARVGALKVRVHRAREMLRDRLGERLELVWR